MSEFMLSYFMIDKSRGKLKKTACQTDSFAKKILRETRNLEEQTGFGMDHIRDRMYHLSGKLGTEADQIRLLEQFLYYLEKQIKEADREAAGILNDFSVIRKENDKRNLGFVTMTFQSIMTIIGAISGDNFAVTWLDDFGSTILGAAEGDEVDEIIGKGITTIGKLMTEKEMTEMIELLSKGKCKTAGLIVPWAVDFIEDVIENFMDRKGTVAEDIGESAVEGVLGLVLLAGGICAGAAAVGAVSAVAAVPTAVTMGIVGAMTIVVKWASDVIANEAFQNEKGFVENIGDVVCNWAGGL